MCDLNYVIYPEGTQNHCLELHCFLEISRTSLTIFIEHKISWAFLLKLISEN